MIKRRILRYLENEMVSDKVIVLTGMRRVGKTTLIRYLYDKVQDKRRVYLDLENPLNQSYLNQLDFDAIKASLERIAQGTKKEIVIFLDEIQNVRNLPSIVKYLYDHYGYKFVLTGSASFYLKNLFSESLAGRKRVFELFPLTFEEFLSYKAPQIVKPTLKEIITEQLFHLMQKYQTEFITYGGFPSVVTKNSHEEKVAEIEDIFTSYFQKEVQLLSDFRKLTAVRTTMLLLTERVGNKLDVSKMASELGISRITLMEYLEFLEGTYFLSQIYPFSLKLDVSFRGQKKPYFCDNGFLTQRGNTPTSVLLENAMFNLLRHLGSVFYYQTKAGAEIDFVVVGKDYRYAFEVKTQAHETDVRKLHRLARRLGIQKYLVISGKFTPITKHIIYPFQL